MSGHPGFVSAFERIEEGILPSVSMMLDTLLDAATLGKPGVNADAYAAELRSLAREMSALTRQVEIAAAQPAADYRDSSAA